MTEKVKLCPFCGNKPKIEIALTGSGRRRMFAVCGCNVMRYEFIPLKEWNTRTNGLTRSERKI